jgi:hypothetical protein
MVPQFVKPYVKTNKNDAADAEAICEAVSRPNMRFEPIKTPDQQAVLALHRARQGFVRQRTAQGNQIRGLLAEYGVTIPQGIRNIRTRLPEILEDGEIALPGLFRQLLRQLGEHLRTLDQLVNEMDQQIQQWHRSNEASQRLTEIAGVGLSLRPPRWHRSEMLEISAVVGNWRHGWGLCPGNTPAEVSRCRWGSASAATAICVRWRSSIQNPEALANAAQRVTRPSHPTCWRS